jgi:hypothetical protein
LSSVFVKIVENEVNDIASDGSDENVGKSDFTDGGVRIL